MVGGGITGLVAGFRLAQRSCDVAVLEADDRPGGKVLTREEAGYLLEWGPSSLQGGSPALERLLEDLRLWPEVVYTRPAARRRYVLWRGRLRKIPTGPLSLALSSLLSLRGKLRLLLEPFRDGPGPEGEDVRSFFARRFGPQVAERLADPFVSGIYAGDPGLLEAASAFPRLVALERRHGSVIGGFWKARKEPRPETRTRRRQLLSFRRGLRTLPEALARGLGDRLRLGARAEAIRGTGAGWTVAVRRGGSLGEVLCDSVVLACPAPAAAALLAPLAPAAAEALRGIPYAPVALHALSYPEEPLRRWDGFGFLCPSSERAPILGALWSSRIFEGRAPAGRFLMTGFLGGAAHPDAAAAPGPERDRVVREFLASTLGAEAPEQAWSHLVPEAIPQLTIGHTRRIAAARAACASLPGLHLAGAYAGGVSVPSCAEDAERVASEVAPGYELG